MSATEGASRRDGSRAEGLGCQRGVTGGLWGSPRVLRAQTPQRRTKVKGRAWSFASALVAKVHLPVGIFLERSSAFISFRGP